MMKNHMTASFELDVTDFKTPATAYPEDRVNTFRIKRIKYPKGYYEYYGMDGMLFWRAVKPIPVTLLQELRGSRWKTWMVDDPPHWRAMQHYASLARGHVVTTGLGLGLVTHELLKNPNVTEITVVERSYDVMCLVVPRLSPVKPLNIVLCDFYDWLDRQRTPVVDTLIVDLWVTHNAEQKRKLYFKEVVPLQVRLLEKFPDALTIFHGFSSEHLPIPKKEV